MLILLLFFSSYFNHDNNFFIKLGTNNELILKVDNNLFNYYNNKFNINGFDFVLGYQSNVFYLPKNLNSSIIIVKLFNKIKIFYLLKYNNKQQKIILYIPNYIIIISLLLMIFFLLFIKKIIVLIILFAILFNVYSKLEFNNILQLINWLFYK